MELRLFFTELPQTSALEAMDRRLENLCRKQEPVDGGRRLWITHVPETRTRPLLNARPFDIFVMPMRFSDSEIEDFRVGIGVSPKRCMICREQDDMPSTVELLFAIAAEIMSRCSALLRIDECLGRRMFDVDDRELEFPSECLEAFPGHIYEVAHELPDGDLALEWFVDARWLLAWMHNKYAKNKVSAELSRFSSLDYS